MTFDGPNAVDSRSGDFEMGQIPKIDGSTCPARAPRATRFASALREQRDAASIDVRQHRSDM